VAYSLITDFFHMRPVANSVYNGRYYRYISQVQEVCHSWIHGSQLARGLAKVLALWSKVRHGWAGDGLTVPQALERLRVFGHLFRMLVYLGHNIVRMHCLGYTSHILLPAHVG
jgi:hypothetical protein